MRRSYGWKPSLPDPHAFIADPTGLAEAPATWNPLKEDPSYPAIVDQGQLGSCTANATARLFRYSLTLDGHDPGPLSRLWIYYGERRLEDDLGKGDTGAFGHDAFRIARHTGLLTEKEWPYEPDKFDQYDEIGAPLKFTTDAKKLKIERPYRKVSQGHDEDTYKRILANKQTIAFGFTVYESFESDEVNRTGIVPMPKKGERQMGGHEVIAVGYDEAHPGYLVCDNSWGTDWGVNGQFYFPLAYFTNPNLSGDHRTIPR